MSAKTTQLADIQKLLTITNIIIANIRRKVDALYDASNNETRAKLVIMCDQFVEAVTFLIQSENPLPPASNNKLVIMCDQFVEVITYGMLGDEPVTFDSEAN